MPSRSRLLITLSLSSLAVTTVSCRDRNSLSVVKYAHAGSSQLLSTPIGRLGLQDSGITHSLGNGLNICVRKYGVNQYSDKSLLLETKLAHAMWLKAAGYGANEFSRLKFTVSESCTKEFASVIALEHPEITAQATGDNAGQFNEPKLSCGPRGATAYGCSSDGGITLGWGTPGSLNYSYLADNPKKWTKVASAAPSMVRLSPYVDWQSLEDGVHANSEISDEAKTKISAAYQELLNDNEQTFDVLGNFNNLLGENGVTMAGDQEFSAIMKQSAPDRETFSGRAYRPRQAAFHTLIHEVGHTFGLTHADNPGQGDITGPSATTVFDPSRNQYVTKMSSMAYGAPYGFLTEDDRLGVTAADSAIRAEIASHR